MSFDRMIKNADDLVGELNLRDPPNAKPRDGVIAELDAMRFIVKSFRELRHGIALGGQVDAGAIDAITERMAKHLGVTGAALNFIRDALEEETDAFAAEFTAGVERLGKHAHFHEDHGVLDSRTFPAEANNSPPPSEPVLRATFEKSRKARQR